MRMCRASHDGGTLGGADASGAGEVPSPSVTPVAVQDQALPAGVVGDLEREAVECGACLEDLRERGQLRLRQGHRGMSAILILNAPE